MSTSDFSKPVVGDAYGNFASETVNNFTDLAKGLDPATTTPANLPTNAICWSSANNYWEIWNGTSWAQLSSLYEINISGNAATATTSAACSGNAATASSAAACTGNSATASSANALNTSNTYQVKGLGIGVSPFGWSGTNVYGLDVGVEGSLFTGPGSGFNVATNTYYNGTNQVAKVTGAAGVFSISTSGTHAWSSAPSVSAGATQTFTQTLGLDASGNLTATANVTAYSDERLKKKWRKVGQDFVARLGQVKSGTYERKKMHGLRQVGVSAQSLQEILPEAVLQDQNGVLSVAYGNAALVACVELAKEVVALRAEIKKLKAKK